MFKYSISVKWSDEDGGFIATSPELPGLSAFGETQEEAFSELKIAGKAFLESLTESGESLPSPEKLVSYSGQLRIRMPKSLHAKLSSSAESEKVSLNTYIVSLLSERQGEKETAKLFKEIIDLVQKSQYTVGPEDPNTKNLQSLEAILSFDLNAGSESNSIRREN